ncbi:GAF domain-containing protein [Microbacterium karelineae]|uniref:GAF domain-containing protein n=1 Tax=Microbacterium karelineae TaxID=2654283 RepID=UPI0018D3B73A|nr:GAF domain-containing protein [Microbacterium karelineae]
MHPLLDRIPRNAARLLNCRSGSVCLVDEDAGTCTKHVDFGVGCQEVQTFSLEEGATGAVVRSRGAVIAELCPSIAGSHIPPRDPRYLCPVIGVPIWWADQLVGACVIVRDEPGESFTAADVQILDLFARHAAMAIETAQLHARATARERELAVVNVRERAVSDIYNTMGRSLKSVVRHIGDGRRRLGDGHDVQMHLQAVYDGAIEALSDARLAASGLPRRKAARTSRAWCSSFTGLRRRLDSIRTSR